jgi:hypothetical protein
MRQDDLPPAGYVTFIVAIHVTMNVIVTLMDACLTRQAALAIVGLPCADCRLHGRSIYSARFFSSSSCSRKSANARAPASRAA